MKVRSGILGEIKCFEAEIKYLKGEIEYLKVRSGILGVS